MAKARNNLFDQSFFFTNPTRKCGFVRLQKHPWHLSIERQNIEAAERKVSIGLNDARNTKTLGLTLVRGATLGARFALALVESDFGNTHYVGAGICSCFFIVGCVLPFPYNKAVNPRCPIHKHPSWRDG